MKLISSLFLVTAHGSDVSNSTIVENGVEAIETPVEATWTQWEACTAQCGGGTRVRLMEPCAEECQTETEECSTDACEWSDWSTGTCSKTCGAGLATRSRTCPESGKCIGSSEETITCNEAECSSKTNTWKPWGQWTECTQSCGIGGRKRRTRVCDGDCSKIEGPTNIQIWRCRENIKCPSASGGQQGKWTNWANWTACEGSCTGGRKKRFRNCTLGWGKCPGQFKEEVPCKPNHCQLMNQSGQNHNNNEGWGNWQQWNSWSNCSKTCGAGIAKRSRQCQRGPRRGCKTQRGSESMREEVSRFCRVKECPKQWVNNWQQRTTQKPHSSHSAAKPTIKSPTGNLLLNGNAEKTPGTWGTTTNWFCNSCSASRWTSDKKEGGSSIKISGRKASWAGINYNLGNKISNGGSYHLKGFVKPLVGGHHKMAVTAKIENGGKPQYLQQVSKVVAGNQWTEISGVVSVSGGSVTIYIEGMEKHSYLIDGFSLTSMGGGGQPVATTSPPTIHVPKHDDGKQKLKDPGFEISPNWGIGWGCQGCDGVPVTDDVKFGKRAMKVTNRKDTWAGPVQSLKYGSHIMKNVVYNAQVWIKSLGNDERMDTYELTVKIDYRNKKDVWLKFGKLCTTPSAGWGLLSGMVQIKDDPHLVNQLEFYVEGPVKTRDYLVDGASLKVQKVPDSFYKSSDEAIDRLRKVDLTVVADYADHSNVTIKVEQKRHDFPFGSAIDARLLTSNSNYRKFFMDNFNYAVFENKMKWRQIEWSRGNRNFHDADQAMKILEQNNIPVRGHATFWGVDQYVPKWLKGMTKDQQLQQCKAHADDIVGRYKGRLTHWDVNNEMLHGDYFERTLGNNIRAKMFQWVKEADPSCMTFTNDYEVLSGGLTNCYKKQIADLIKNGAPIDGIGVQSHFKDAERNVDPVQVQAKLDSLGELALPIWVTELDISQHDAKARAAHLGYFLRAAFSHESVEGIILWGYWDQRHWRGKEASLADGPNLTLNAAGQKYRDLVFKKWWTTEEAENSLETRAFKGDYTIKAIAEDGSVLDTKTISLKTDQVVCFGTENCEANLKSAEFDDSGSGDSEIDSAVNI